MIFRPRPAQREILSYSGGRLGVSAVPGSGKTRTLSALAARLVAEQIGDGQEVLIVTLTNSAVENFTAQIRAFLNDRGLLPTVGYRVRTLHSLCADIVRENPALLGLSDTFVILDDREARDILNTAAANAVRAASDLINGLIDPEMAGAKRETIARQEMPGLLTDIASAAIQRAKDLRLTPDALAALIAAHDDDDPILLAEFCVQVYTDYQRAITYRGAVDFQDLIRLGVQALESDPALLTRMRARWPYVLEDEAQDSSALQERILRLLTGDDGNWVRVGDPNQAIYETFTTANPELLWDFLNEPGVRARDLPDSGRSAEPIQTLANHLIGWSQHLHPSAAVRSRRPLRPPLIRPVPREDGQPNPPSETARLAFIGRGLTPAEEVERTIASIARWLPDHPDETCAVLVPRNRRGYDLIDYVNKNMLDIPLVAVLGSSTSTRQAAGALGNVLHYLSHPDAPGWLAKVYRVWRRDTREDAEANAHTLTVAKLLNAMPHVEAFTAPVPGGGDWLREAVSGDDPSLTAELEQFRELVRRWSAASVLPIDQLILVVAGDLFTEPADLALAHSLAVVLRGYANREPGWRLPQFTEQLAEIARNERRFLGMDDQARAFHPDDYRGKVAVTTMHSAKGLEWDRVYLLSVNAYDFPSDVPGDEYFDEKYFIRDRLNLRAEALAQLAAAVDPFSFAYIEGQATIRAREEFAGERLRLLYVGITRARKEVILSFNTGRRGNQSASAAFIELRRFAQTDLKPYFSEDD